MEHRILESSGLERIFSYFFLVYDSIIPNTDRGTFIMVWRTFLAFMNSVQNTYTSEMQIYEAHLGFHKFKIEQLLFCFEPPLLLFFKFMYFFFLHFLTVHIQSESSFLRTFYGLWFISFPQSCFWKKSSGFRPCLAGSMVSFCQTAILTFSDVCLGEDMLGRTVAICQTFDLRNRKEL